MVAGGMCSAASTGASVVQSSSRLGLLGLLLLGSGVVVVLAGLARSLLIISDRELGQGRDLVLELFFGAPYELLLLGVFASSARPFLPRSLTFSSVPGVRGLRGSAASSTVAAGLPGASPLPNILAPR